MATLYTTGPCHLYVQTVNPSTGPSGWLYLGTAEDSPSVEITPVYEDVFNSIGGHVPFDKSYQGELATINAALNRLNLNTYYELAARPAINISTTVAPGGASPAGTNLVGAVGTLVATEGYSVQLLLLFAYGANGQASKTVFTTQGMPPGYLFYSTTPIGPDVLKPLGTTPLIVDMTFLAMRQYNPTTGTFALYTNVIPTGLPAPN